MKKMMNRHASVEACSASGAMYITQINRQKHVCICLFIPGHVGNSDAGPVLGPHPVHDEYLADIKLVLKLLGSDGHRVEETETPMDKQTVRKRSTCVQQDIFTESISLNYHMDLRNLKGSSLCLWCHMVAT